MIPALHGALERALLDAIALAGHEAALRRLAEENRVALMLLPDAHLARVKHAFEARLARLETVPAAADPPPGRSAQGTCE